MLLVSLLRWWYGAGWVDQVGLVRRRFDATADLFSLELSLRTLFRPFKQIDADAARGPLPVMLRATFDQMFSRVFGAVLRLLLICIGSVAILCEAIIGTVRLLIWPLLPMLPVLALPISMTGWIPWR